MRLLQNWTSSFIQTESLADLTDLHLAMQGREPQPTNLMRQQPGRWKRSASVSNCQNHDFSSETRCVLYTVAAEKIRYTCHSHVLGLKHFGDILGDGIVISFANDAGTLRITGLQGSKSDPS